MTLAEKLNQYQASPVVGKGQLGVGFEPDDKHLDADGAVPPGSELDQLIDALQGDAVWVDRNFRCRENGLVLVVEFEGETAWFDHNEGWFAC